MIIDQSNFLRINNGIIETHRGKRVIGTLPTTEKVVVTDDNALSQLTFPLVAYGSYEVMMIRVYYTGEDEPEEDGRWHISTRCKLDAYESYWANDISIGEQFERVVEQRVGVSEMGLDIFLESLDIRKGYFFLISLTDKQVTGNITNPENGLWLAGIEENGKITLDIEVDEKDDHPWSKAWDILPKYEFKHPEDLKHCVLHQYDGASLTGVTICQNDKFIKVVHPEYYRLMLLRNNEPNIYKRALEIMGDIQLKRRPMAELHDFTTQHHCLKWFVKDVWRMVALLHKTYLAKYVQRRTISYLPSCQYALLKKCHEQYLKHRVRITKDVMMSVLFTFFQANVILKMLKTEDEQPLAVRALAEYN